MLVMAGYFNNAQNSQLCLSFRERTLNQAPISYIIDYLSIEYELVVMFPDYRCRRFMKKAFAMSCLQEL